MIFVLVGPTGVGKSSLALKYALDKGAYIINGDAFQCYKEMNIGTAKPSLKERNLVPSFLFDRVSITYPYTIFDYQKDLRSTLDKLLSDHKDIIIVGGSGLYLKSALYDFTLNEQVNKVDMSKYEALSDEDLHHELELIDKVEAEKIHFHNRKRVLRAIEIYLESGNKKSDLIAAQEHKMLYPAVFIGLTKSSREELYQLINARVDEMVKEGLFDEVHDLITRYPSSLRAFLAIGYKEIIEGEKENKTREEIIELIKKNTRNYAKRQYTYFNNQLDVNWFDDKMEAYRFMEEAENGTITR